MGTTRPIKTTRDYKHDNKIIEVTLKSSENTEHLTNNGLIITRFLYAVLWIIVNLKF